MTLPALSLEGRVAVVIGGTSGIGLTLAQGLTRAGADVVPIARRREHVEAAAAEVEALGRRSLRVTADVTDRASLEAALGACVSALGKVDVLVNNAGTIRRAPAAEHSDEDWDLVLAVDLSSPFRLSREVGKRLIARGARGKIVNVASLLSFQGGILVPSYAAAKGGLAQLTKALANEWAPKGINVNAIAPGYMRTDNTAALRADANRSRQILERIPAGRWGEPEDLAGVVVFLASSASDYVNGHVVVVDGGWLAR